MIRRTAGLIGLTATMALLSACSVGQVTQTADKVPPISGANLATADGLIKLRDLTVAYTGPAGTPAGGTAALNVRIFNTGNQPARLTGVASEQGEVVLVDPAAMASASPLAPAPSGSAAAPASAAPSGSAVASGSAGPSGSAVPSASGSPSAAAPSSPAASVPAPGAQPGPVGSTTIDLLIPAGSYALLLPEAPRHLAVSNLTGPVKPGGSIPVTFVFTYADGTTTSAATTIPVAVPLSPAPRVVPSVESEH